MINGAHVVLSSTDAEADRAFLAEVLALPHVDVGHGWLIFGLPPAEVAVHPSERSDHHELFLMCEDIDAVASRLGERGVACSPIEEPPWGRLLYFDLPGGGRLGVYQPKHERPPNP